MHHTPAARCVIQIEHIASSRARTPDAICCGALDLMRAVVHTNALRAVGWKNNEFLFNLYTE